MKSTKGRKMAGTRKMKEPLKRKGTAAYKKGTKVKGHKVKGRKVEEMETNIIDRRNKAAKKY